MTGIGNDAEQTDPLTVEWRKLDPRSVLITLVHATPVIALAAVAGGVSIGEQFGTTLSTAIVAPAALVFIILVAVFDDLRRRRTSYRVLPDSVELREGILVRNRRSLSRDRIRSVDITAPVLLRLFGLVRVQIGTAEQVESGDSSVVLHPVPAAEGDRLRRELLEQTPEAHGETTDSAVATFVPSWIRFAPISLSTLLFGVAFFGGVFRFAPAGVFDRGLGVLASLSVTVAIGTVIGTGLLVGVLASVAVFVEKWWRFRLDRPASRTLRVRRGLLTTRSISLEEERLRGVEVLESLGHRLLGGAQLDAVATGLVEEASSRQTGHKTLLPPAPRWDVDQVSADVLREAVPPIEAVRLQKHPSAARGRRVRWGLLFVAIPVVPLLVLGLTVSPLFWHPAWISALILIPVVVALAFDAYHNLGHGISGHYLVARRGTLRRSTVALQRTGIIGWTASQSIFQRHRGLMTLTATTSAGEGAYAIYDLDEEEGLVFAEEAVPDLFGPFLERV